MFFRKEGFFHRGNEMGKEQRVSHSPWKDNKTLTLISVLHNTDGYTLVRKRTKVNGES